MESARSPGWTRRRVLTAGLGGAVVAAGAAVAGAELVSRGVLPGGQLLDRADGACSVARPPLRFAAPGPALSGEFYSRARHRQVGYMIAYPPGHGPGERRPGSRLPLVVVLHAYGGSHASRLGGLSLARALALRADGPPLAPMAMVAADGGTGYWNPHPGDDPLAMVVDELVPMCRRRGLGAGGGRVGTLGISMGGYGALLVAERYPRLVGAVAAISPAVWTSYAQARQVNAGAYASAADFAADDVVTHAAALAGVPVRVASGDSDPFHPGVQALAKALPPGAVVDFSRGCHTGSFFLSQVPPSLAFLARHLAPA